VRPGGTFPGKNENPLFVAALRNGLPAECVLAREEELRPYECDGLTAFRQIPLAVVLPRTEDQVREIISVCHRLDVPVVARGSGTGLSGGAMPHGAGSRSVARAHEQDSGSGPPSLARLESNLEFATCRCPKRQPLTVCTMRPILLPRSHAR